MTNAAEEFKRHVGDKALVLCAIVKPTDYEEGVTSLLPLGYTPEDYVGFIQSLDYEYYAGYGSQKLTGTIWYSDGTWSGRGEYDGMEWWEYYCLPQIPDLLK